MLYSCCCCWLMPADTCLVSTCLQLSVLVCCCLFLSLLVSCYLLLSPPASPCLLLPPIASYCLLLPALASCCLLFALFWLPLPPLASCSLLLSPLASSCLFSATHRHSALTKAYSVSNSNEMEKWQKIVALVFTFLSRQKRKMSQNHQRRPFGRFALAMKKIAFQRPLSNRHTHSHTHSHP